MFIQVDKNLFFSFLCVNVSCRRNRHSLATLLFSEVAPHFPNERRKEQNLNLKTEAKERESED